MGIPAINSIANMEYLLYGQYGMNGGACNCPSITNGYRAQANLYGGYPNYYAGYSAYNPSFMGSPAFGNSVYSNPSSYDSYTSSAPSVGGFGTTFGASQADLDILGQYYEKGLAPSESMLGAAFSGVTFAMMNNPRTVVHPWNFFLTASKATDEVFAGIKKEGSSLYKLWRNPETTNIMQEAYSRMHKLEALNNSKLGLFRKRIDSARYNELKKAMTDALNFSGSEKDKIQKIAEATELIKRKQMHTPVAFQIF